MISNIPGRNRRAPAHPYRPEADIVSHRLAPLARFRTGAPAATPWVEQVRSTAAVLGHGKPAARNLISSAEGWR
jgi:hypothetical protein